MFEDVRHSRGVGGIRLEADAEDIVLVLSRYVQVVRAGLVVCEVQGRQFELRHMLRSLEGEAMELLSGGWETRQVGDRGISSLANGAEKASVWRDCSRRTFGGAQGGQH